MGNVIRLRIIVGLLSPGEYIPEYGIFAWDIENDVLAKYEHLGSGKCY